jgi:hypothetical protein
MKQLVLLLLIVGAGWIGLKVLREGNAPRGIAKALALAPPAKLEYEWRLWGTEHLKVTNLSDKPLHPERAVVTTAEGVKYNVTLPAMISAHGTVDARMRTGDGFFAGNIMLKKGDSIEVTFQGYPIPAGLLFNE